MGTTAQRLLPYPEPSDTARDAPLHIKALADALDKPHVCTIYTNTAQTIADAGVATCLFDAVGDDPNGWANLANDSITIGARGRYVITFEVTWGAAGAGYVQGSVLVDGVNIATTHQTTNSWRTATHVQTTPILLDVGDVVQAQIAQNTTGPVPTVPQAGPGGITSPRLSVHRVA